jgi:hypothetical protein
MYEVLKCSRPDHIYSPSLSIQDMEILSIPRCYTNALFVTCSYVPGMVCKRKSVWATIRFCHSGDTSTCWLKVGHEYSLWTPHFIGRNRAPDIPIGNADLCSRSALVPLKLYVRTKELEQTKS